MSDRASPPTPAPVATTEQKPDIIDADARIKEESPGLPSPTAGVAQNSEAPSSSPSRSARRIMTTVAQRRALLQDDPLTLEVEAHRVHCRACHKWIRLALTQEYTIANWKSHKQRCPGSPRVVRRTPSKRSFSPGSRVATAERKIVLLNDQQVKAFSTGHVECGNCKTVVALQGVDRGVDYELARWTEHKEKCIPMTPAPITPQGSRPRTFPPPSTSSAYSRVSTGRPARSPTPAGEGSGSNLTEINVAPTSSPAGVEVGVKRGREAETEGTGEVAADERPTNRPRTETYKPPEKGAPSPFGWLMQPLKEFARGFREGLGST